MTPEEITQALHQTLADLLDCAETGAERELLIGFALNLFEQCQERQQSEIFSEQIKQISEQLDSAVPFARFEPTEPLAEIAAVAV